jgi:kynurenine formamidase
LIARITVGGVLVRVDFSRPCPIAIPLDPHGQQPRFFSSEPAKAEPLRASGFIGDMQQGGSCNAERISMAAHCHGTHTEGVGHLLPKKPAVHETIDPSPALALLVSLRANESAAPRIERDELQRALEPAWQECITALVIRTLPNETGKMQRDYDQAVYPVLAPDAMDLLAGLPLNHLLIDTPSLDPARDGGQLTNHRRWWGLDEQGTGGVDGRRRSVTEMIFVPDELADGTYWLQLGMAPLVSDATPSRPVLYPAELPE